MKKFELTAESKIFAGKKLFRIKALISFGNVEEGELGGFVEKEENLDQSGDAWVSDNAWVYGDAWVSGNARVYGNAWVSDNARVSGNAWVSDNARVSGDAWVSDNAWVYGDAWVSDNAWVYGNAWVSDNARVYGNAWVSDNARVSGDAWVSDNVDYATVHGFGSEYRTTTFFRTKAGDIGVRCGCFYGTLEEFRAKVKETHGETKTAKEYLMVADLMEFRFSKEEA